MHLSLVWIYVGMPTLRIYYCGKSWIHFGRAQRLNKSADLEHICYVHTGENLTRLILSTVFYGLLILAMYDLEIRFHDLMNLDAQSLMQFSSTEVKLDDGCKIHLSKQFSVNEFTSEVAYAVAISVAMEDLTWSLTC
ncbi:hypothetical protein OGATHE_000985 [Ogataea polymorpha]|uniref:Uncharacterized protein n=1 Tax=Ogataea polymorpha TaxID=460523 RepID=A0A9P8TG93_9ASCO|nr:hypothetical protein OGATHE_000985 [Ogataea polymorpha]